jgi:trimethyllysine dioxygenase
MANQEVIVDFNAGTALRYPSFWLRDHCPCDVCQHPSTHQRQLDTFAIDPDIKASSVEPTAAGLQITWPSQPPDESHHTSVYPWEWLETHPPFVQGKPGTKPVAGRTWTHVRPSDPPASLPRVLFDSISTKEGLTSFLSSIHECGMCFIPSTPPTPEATQTLVERIAHIRPTHYGGFWDFTSEVNPIDTAYTNDPLPPHTDTTYFTDPAGLQLFHLLSHTSLENNAMPGKGGESTFVDGFAAASHLHRHFPQHYRALATYPVTSAALGSPAGSFFNTESSVQGYPVLNHSSPAGTPSAPSPATLMQVRWNNLDRMAPPTPSFPNHTALKSWYAAAREWARILESPEFLLTVKLQPGEPVIFDNWRVLHGRLGFEGKRRVCGAYVGMDDFRARCRSLGIHV